MASLTSAPEIIYSKHLNIWNPLSSQGVYVKHCLVLNLKIRFTMSPSLIITYVIVEQPQSRSPPSPPVHSTRNISIINVVHTRTYTSWNLKSVATTLLLYRIILIYLQFYWSHDIRVCRRCTDRTYQWPSCCVAQPDIVWSSRKINKRLFVWCYTHIMQRDVSRPSLNLIF